MKRFFKIIPLILIFICMPVCAEGVEVEHELIDDYISMYGETLGDGIAAVGSSNVEKVIPGFSVQEILSDLTQGKNIFSPREILGKGTELLLAEVRHTLKVLIFIPALAILGSYIISIQDGMKIKGAAQASFFACYCLIAGIAAAAFFEVIGCGREVIRNVSVFMRVLIPVALVSLASSGAVVSATTFEMVLMSVIELTQWMVEKLFLPLVMMSSALNIANNLSAGLNAEKLVQLINKSVKWGLGIMLTLFVGITGLQGIAAGSADGLTVKVTKFAASNLIPMVGGILSETVETVMNCSVVIKNSVGVAGIIVVIAMNVIPILKVAACLIIFRLCAAVIQPISDARCVKCLTELGDSVSSVLSMTVAVVVMFVVILTIVLNIGNTALMLGR